MAKCDHYWMDFEEKDGKKVKWCALCGAKK